MKAVNELISEYAADTEDPLGTAKSFVAFRYYNQRAEHIAISRLTVDQEIITILERHFNIELGALSALFELSEVEIEQVMDAVDQCMKASIMDDTTFENEALSKS